MAVWLPMLISSVPIFPLDGDIEIFSLIDGMRDVPLREGMVRNVSVEQVKTVLRGAGFPDNQAPLRFIVMALKLRDQVVLIDSGTGGHPIYGEGNGRLFESMAAAGLDPKAVKTSSSPISTATTFMAS